MEKVIKVYKNQGETPLECLNRIKSEDKNYAHLPMTYAGRLDPMAEGLLLVLVGDECQKKDQYTAMPKEYEVDVLFGFATDTFDLLGLITNERKDVVSGSLAQGGDPSRSKTQQSFMGADGNNILSELEKFKGKILQKYPPYSSRTVSGKPLFQWAREERLGEIEVPSHEVYVESIEVKKTSEISGKKLLKDIEEKIAKVSGDFRQTEILNKWEEVLKDKGEEKFQVVKLLISCSSGTYVRAIAQELGESLGTPALAMKIVRTKIGDFSLQ